jgi:enoyl-CoA hydratase/carnithine racemase
MGSITLSRVEDVCILTLHREKVNALDRSAVLELSDRLEGCALDSSIGALVITGQGKFFSFGFDVPALYPLPEDEFTRFLQSFTSLYTNLYTFPKPVIAALNGHTIAGGCMLALACDRRLMAEGSGKISLNEVTFGATVFAGSVEMLRACVGQRHAEEILLSGTMYDPPQALNLGLIDRITSSDDLVPAAIEEARFRCSHDATAASSLKKLLREPVTEVMRLREDSSIREFVDIWYSEATRKALKRIEIRKT